MTRWNTLVEENILFLCLCLILDICTWNWIVRESTMLETEIDGVGTGD